MAFRIQSQEIVYGKRLGAGGFGEVFQAKWDHTEVAVKQLALKNMSESTAKEFEKEVKVHIDLRHPHIAQLYGVTSQQPYGMVMEFMENGSLDSYLQKNPPQNVSWSLKFKIALAVSNALAYLHKKGIVHRDLKSLNVLLNEALIAKVCDFGLAKVKTETMSKTGFKGSIQWSAPELFTLKPVYSEKTDTYSYGIVLWELASHEYPYKETPPFSIPSLVKDGERESFPENTPKAFEELAKKCWDGKAANRPGLESVIVTLEFLLAALPSSNSTSPVNPPQSQSNQRSHRPLPTPVQPSGILNQNNNNSGYLQSTTNNKQESLDYMNPFTQTGNTNPLSNPPNLNINPSIYPQSIPNNQESIGYIFTQTTGTNPFSNPTNQNNNARDYPQSITNSMSYSSSFDDSGGFFVQEKKSQNCSIPIIDLAVNGYLLSPDIRKKITYYLEEIDRESHIYCKWKDPSAMAKLNNDLSLIPELLTPLAKLTTNASLLSDLLKPGQSVRLLNGTTHTKEIIINAVNDLKHSREMYKNMAVKVVIENRYNPKYYFALAEILNPGEFVLVNGTFLTKEQIIQLGEEMRAFLSQQQL